MKDDYFAAGVLALFSIPMFALALFGSSNGAVVGGTILGAVSLASALALAVERRPPRTRRDEKPPRDRWL